MTASAQHTRILPLVFKPGCALFVLPNRRNPRFVAQSTSPQQRWRDSRWFPAYTPASKVIRLLQRLTAMARPIIMDSPSNDASHTPCFDRLGFDDYRCAMLFGSPGPRQKCSIRVLRSDSSVQANVKLGFSDLARNLIRNEAGMLEALPSGLGPTRLDYMEAPEYTALTMTHLSGHTLSASTSGSYRLISSLAPESCINNFLTRFPVISPVPVANHPAIKRLRASQTVDNALVNALSVHPWPIVLQHGDLAPWNLIVEGPDIRAIDWEDATFDGFPYFDLVHYAVQVGGLIHRSKPEKLKHLVHALLCQHGLIPAQAQAILRLAAMDALRRFQADTRDSPLQVIRTFLAATN